MKTEHTGGAAGAQASAARDGRRLDMYTYLRVLYRRRYVAAAAVLLALGTAVVFGATATRIYAATVQLWVEPRDPQVVPFEQVTGRSAGGPQGFLPMQRDRLTRRSLARAAIERLGLWDHPELVGPDDSFSFDPIALVTRPLERLASSLRSPQPSRPRPSAGVGPDNSPESRRKARAVNRIVGNLRVDANRGSRVVRLTFRAREPQLAADVANTLARLYIEQENRTRSGAAREASAWLQERIAEQRRQLGASEQTLQRYREEHGAASIDYTYDDGSELGQLRWAAAEATRERVLREVRHRDLEAARHHPDALERFPEVLENGYIREQLQTSTGLRRERIRSAEDLGPRHPEMIRIESSIRDAEEQLRSEIAAVVESARLAFDAAKSHEEELLAEAVALERVGIGYEVLRREIDSRQRIYDSLLQRFAETSLVGELETSHIRILDEARVPGGPASPRTRLLLLTGLLSGLFAAAGLVFCAELFDDTVRIPEDIGGHPGTPFLGLIPRVSDEGPGWLRGRWFRSAAAPEPGALALSPGDAPARFVESVRSVCTKLELLGPSEGGRALLVTSAAAGDGKSQMAANLAVEFARMGHRTLLIDLDLRQPQLHALFAQAQAPGLSQLLAGAADDGGVVRPTAVPGLSLAAAGSAAPNAVDLIGSGAFTRFLTSCRERFDRIVVDTVPVQPVADALAAAAAVDEVLFVAAADGTSRRAAKEALEQLAQSGARVAGCVLNKADVERRPAFYYAPHYQPAWERYYRRGGSAGSAT